MWLSETAQLGQSTVALVSELQITRVLGRFCYGSFSKAFVFHSNDAFLRAEQAPPPQKKKKERKGQAKPLHR